MKPHYDSSTLNRSSFRDMVARKREEIRSIAATTVPLASSATSPTTTPTASRMASMKSMSELGGSASNISLGLGGSTNALAGAGGSSRTHSPNKVKKRVSHHGSFDVLASDALGVSQHHTAFPDVQPMPHPRALPSINPSRHAGAGLALEVDATATGMGSVTSPAAASPVPPSGPRAAGAGAGARMRRAGSGVIMGRPIAAGAVGEGTGFYRGPGHEEKTSGRPASAALRRSGSKSALGGGASGSSSSLVSPRAGPSGRSMPAGGSVMNLQPSVVQLEPVRLGSASRRFASSPYLLDDPFTTTSRSSSRRASLADDEAATAAASRARSRRQSDTSDAGTVMATEGRSRRSSMEDISCLKKENRPVIAKRPRKPPPELPPWNTSTKVAPKENAGAKGTPRPSGRSTPLYGNSAPGSQRPSVTSIRPLNDVQGAKRERRDTDAESELDPAESAAADPYGDDIDVDALDGDDADLEDEDEYRNESKYPPTPHQLQVYLKTCPSQEESDGGSTQSLYTGPPFYLSQAYRLDRDVRVSDFAAVVNRICCTYNVLRTRFFRNEKIVDADVEGLLDKTQWYELPQEAFVEEVNPDDYSSLSMVNTATLTSFVRNWIGEQSKLDHTFTVLLFHRSRGYDQGPPTAVFIASTAVCDESSLTWVAREILSLYTDCANVRSRGGSDVAVRGLLDSYTRKEHYSFVDYAYDVSPNKHAMTYWKTQCVETVQETVDESERADLEGQVRRLNTEKAAYKTQVESLTKRKPDLEHELATLKQQRKQVDDGGEGGAVTTYLDATSGEVIRISEQAKAALIRTVLGEEATGDHITSLLDKHEVSLEVQRKIGAADMSIETFASLSEGVVTAAGLLTKDRRKIMALSEYVRNRIKESLQEQSKVKFQLERRIAKVARDLETCTSNLKSAQDALESNDDMCIRLTNLLNPPYVELKIPPVALDKEADTLVKSTTTTDYAQKWAFAPLSIPSEVLSGLRSFQEGFQTHMRQRRAHLRGGGVTLSSSFGHDSDPGYPSSGGDDSSGADSDSSLGLTSRHLRLSSPGAVCLAAFAVLLKHVSGNDKFLVGITQSYRHNGVLVGPLSDTVPLKVDFTRKGTTFNSLFGILSKELKEARRFGIACPSSVIQRQLGIEGGIPVRFEFIPFRDAEMWRQKGLSNDDILLGQYVAPSKGGAEESASSAGGGVAGGGASGESDRLWSVDEQTDFDLKLVLVEGQNSILGGMRYRKDKFDEEKVAKWIAKYMSTLEGIEFGPRKIAITNMISRQVEY
ncbi:hypothetical protein HK104_005074 [Borealophlyctis nickersoniae]|nr:hypothetical protein HK104_005074 [Borealophlyctis nickersoniae]